MADKKLDPLKMPAEETPEVPGGGIVPKEVTAAGEEFFKQPSPPEAPKPVDTGMANYGAGRQVVPDVVSQQYKVPWYHPLFERMYKGNTGQPQSAKRYDMNTMLPTSFAPDVKAIYQKYGVPLGEGDTYLPSSYFAHNVPLALWLPDNRIIQAQDEREFGALLWYMTRNGGEDYDPNIQRPTQNYTLQQMKQWQAQGDEGSVRIALSENVRAGNVSQQQAEEYLTGKKTLDELAAETDYQLGAVNNNPVTNRPRAMTAADYWQWAQNQDTRSYKTQWTLTDALSMFAGTADYLRVLQDKARAKKAKGDEFDEITIPEIPDNWTDWDAIPDEFMAYDDGKADKTGILSQGLKQYKTYIEGMIADFETDLNKTMTGGWRAKVVIPNWADPHYEIHYVSPGGVEVDRYGRELTPPSNVENIDSIYEFTGTDVDKFKRWAKANKDDYTFLMSQLLEVNPRLTALLAKEAGWQDNAGIQHEYTEEELLRIRMGNVKASTEGGLENKFLQIAENPVTPSGQPDDIGHLWQGSITAEEMAQLTKKYDTWADLRDFLTNPDNPDRLKIWAMGVIKEGDKEYYLEPGLLPVLSRAFQMAVSGLMGRDTPYDYWNPGPGIKEAITLFEPWYWMIGGEAAGPVEQGIGKVAAALMKGGRAKGLAAAKEVGGDAEQLIAKAEVRIAKEVESAMSPQEFTGAPRVVDVKPDARVGDVIQTPEGLKQVERPQWRKASPDEPVPADGEIFIDEVTGARYVRKDTVVQAEQKSAGGAGQPTAQVAEKQAAGTTTPAEAVKPQETAVSGQKVGEAAPAERQLTAVQSARQEVQDAWNSFKETGIVTDPKAQAEKQLRLYTALVKLAKAHIDEGIKTIEDFARIAGIEINAAVKSAWNAALKGEAGDFEILSQSEKNSLNSVKMAIKRDFNPQQQTAVDHFRQTADNFDEIWDAITAERQAQLKQKTARLAEAQTTGAGAERIAAENEARRGILTDIGITPEKMAVTPEDAQVLDDLIYAAPDLSPWEKANASKAMRDLIEDFRVPRPFEQEYFKKVFGYDMVNAFKMVDKPRLGDYVTEVLYNSFLSPKSNVVNFGGNSIAALLSPAERFAGGLFRYGSAVKAGSEAAQDIVGFWTGMPEGLRAWLNYMKRGTSGEILKGEVQRTKAFQGPLGRVVNFNTDLMYATDELFKSINQSMAVRSEAYRMAVKEGFKGEQLRERLTTLINNPPEELVTKAKEIAEYRLYRAPSDMANKINRVRDFEIKGLKGIKLGQFLIPFVKTPLNLVKFGLERTPVAILNPKLWGNVVEKNPEAADQIGRWLIGSTIATAIVMYSNDGLITGAPPRSKTERDEFYRLGKQPYSVKIGNKWISYQRLEPFNQIFLQAATISDAIQGKFKNTEELVSQFIAGIGQNAINQTFLSGLADGLNAVIEPERYGGYWLQREAAALMPFSSTLRLATQLTDNTIRSPKGVAQQVQSNIPGLSQNVPAKLNVFGEEQKRETPAWSPYTWTTENSEKINTVLADAGVRPGFVGDSITINKKTYKLTDEEQQEYQVLSGQLMKKRLVTVIEKGMKDKDKLERVISDSKEKARIEYVKLLRSRGREPD